MKIGRGDKGRVVRPLETWLLHGKSLLGVPGSGREPVRGGKEELNPEEEEQQDGLEEE